MKFARLVFVADGVWGIIMVTPSFFLFDSIGRLYSSPINYPQGSVLRGIDSVTLLYESVNGLLAAETR